MRAITSSALIALFLAAPALSREPVERSEREIAEQLWADFRAVDWDRPVREWVGAGTIGTGLDCEEFHGDSYDHTVDTLWSYRCSRSRQNYRAEWFFYALTLDEPLSIRLERFHVKASDLPRSALETLHHDLASRLTERYGAAQEPKRFAGGLAEAGSAFWRNVLRWNNDNLQVYLSISEPHGKSPELSLLARHRRLLDAIALEKKRPYWFKFGPWLERWGTPADRRLAEELGADFRALPDLLLKEFEYPPTPGVQKERRDTLTNLLNAVASAAPQRKPALLLAADRLAARTHDGEEASVGSGAIKDQIAGFDLDYAWNPLGANWVYRHNLLWRVWQEYSASEWGEVAFVLLLNHGWETIVGCSGDGGQFREVIRQAKVFLSDRPKSRFRLEVEFALAQALETWWSVSQASVQDSYVDRSLYLKGSADAREEAIRHYEEVIRISPASYEADYARHQLPRLKLGFDTNQRRFFCIYD